MGARRTEGSESAGRPPGKLELVIFTIAIQGYRSLRELVLPLGQLTVITGANGSGKSSVYRSLRLLADAAQNAVIASLAREGGLSSTFWAGPETIARSAAIGMDTALIWAIHRRLRQQPCSF